MTDHRALLGELAQLLDKGYDDAALEALREHDRELVALANASEAAAVALARQSRAAEISAGLRRLARMPSAAEFAGALQFAADDIDAGRI